MRWRLYTIFYQYSLAYTPNTNLFSKRSFKVYSFRISPIVQL